MDGQDEGNEQEFISQFLAENKPDDTDTPAPANEAEAEVEAPAEAEADESTETEAAADDEAATEAEADDESETEAPSASKLDLKALDKAIEAGDPKAFIEALGPAADKLLGAKAHKALRIEARELKQRQERAKRVEDALMAKYGDPIAVRKAAEAGDPAAADMFVDLVERQFGAGWSDCLKFINNSFAGRPARLEAKAKKQQETEAADKAKTAEAEGKVRSAITDSVKASDAALLTEYPQVVDRVFAAMRAGFHKGVNTPKKALAVVKQDLEKEYQALHKMFGKAAAPKPKATQLRPPRSTPQDSGRELSEEEFREQFLRQEGLLTRGRR